MTIICNRNVIVAAMALLGTISARRSDEQTLGYPQFENDDVKVRKSVIVPDAPLTMHPDHPRVIVALDGGTMKIVEQSDPTEQHV